MSAQLGRAAAFFRVPPGERPWPLHPFLVPPSLIFWLARANLETTPWTVLAHALGLYELGVVGLWLLLALLSRNLRSSAAATTLLAILALHDGELHDLEVVLPIFPVSLGAVVWGLVLLAAGWLVWRGRRLEALTFSINLALGLAAGYQGALLAWTAWQKPAASASQLEEEPLPTAVRAASERPDVVYLILDGMGREDVLEGLFDVRSDLDEFLAARGFFVPSRAVSNYSQTPLSLASALNYDYLPALLPPVDPLARDWRPLMGLLREPRLVAALQAAGYRVVEMVGNYSPVRFAASDERVAPWLDLDELTYFVLCRSVLPRLSETAGLARSYPLNQLHRHAIRWRIDRLASGDLLDDTQPTFVFAHLLVPHPPFVFAPDGSYRPSQVEFGIRDGDHWRIDALVVGEKYAPGYADAARFAMGELRRIIDGLLSRAQRPLAILVHGDHGPGSHLYWEQPGITDMRERLAIFLALRLTRPAAPGSLRETLSPVNAVRLLLGDALGVPMPELEDRAYFSTWRDPFVFHEVTATATARLQE